MKAEIDERGVLQIFAETATEAFALKCWEKNAWVAQQDLDRVESGKWSSTYLIIDTKTKRGDK